MGIISPFTNSHGPSTAKQHWVRFKDGKIVEHWGVEDNLGRMQQLGLVQVPQG